MTADRRECSDARCSIRDRCSSDVPMIAAVRYYEIFLKEVMRTRGCIDDQVV